jgi:hypothetical protein
LKPKLRWERTFNWRVASTTRIPTEGLKRLPGTVAAPGWRGFNNQNPDRGIETSTEDEMKDQHSSFNNQNPDRGGADKV